MFSLLQAQVTISGKVTAKGKALKNVSVTLKDTYDGATTDANGNYTFQTSEKTVIHWCLVIPIMLML